MVKLKNYVKNVGPQFIRYCIVGGLGSIINLAVLYCLTEFVGLWYMFSAVLATGIAVIWNFYGNRTFTFNVGNEKHPLYVLEKVVLKILKIKLLKLVLLQMLIVLRDYLKKYFKKLAVVKSFLLLIIMYSIIVNNSLKKKSYLQIHLMHQLLL